jgi:hypothetical protein
MYWLSLPFCLVLHLQLFGGDILAPSVPNVLEKLIFISLFVLLSKKLWYRHIEIAICDCLTCTCSLLWRLFTNDSPVILCGGYLVSSTPIQECPCTRISLLLEDDQLRIKHT